MKHAFSMFYALIKQGVLANQSAKCARRAGSIPDSSFREFAIGLQILDFRVALQLRYIITIIAEL